MSSKTARYSAFLYADTETLQNYCREAVSRKRVSYWIGFLQGVLSSGRIEPGEPVALVAEAERFIEFFDDPDARDLVADFRSGSFIDADDIRLALSDAIDIKQNEMNDAGQFTEADVLNEFLGFCAGIICDGKILPSEVCAVRKRFDQSELLRSSPTFAQLRSSIERSLADGVVSPPECVEIQSWLARIVGDGYADTGIANIGNVTNFDDILRDPQLVIFPAKRFALTGPMRLGPRSYIVDMIEGAGGFYSSSISKKTHFVVVASTASNMWKTTHYGLKIAKARSLTEAGHPVQLVCETALEKALAIAMSEG